MAAMLINRLKSYCSLAGARRNLNLEPLFAVQSRAIGSKKAVENPSFVAVANIQSGKGNGMVSELDITCIKNDPRKLETMKVEELRTLLRNCGASAKGNKLELTSKLRCILDGKVDGKSSLGDRESCISQETDTVYAEIVSGGRKKQLASQTSRVQQSNRKKQPLANHDDPEEVHAESVVTSEKSATETSKLPGKRPSSKRNLAVDTPTSVAVNESGIINEPWTIFAHKKPHKDWVGYNPRTMRPPPLGSNVQAIKIMSWNVNGLRALLKLEGFSAVELAAREDFDILCLQETLIQEKHVESVKDMLEGYEHTYWSCSFSKLGYSGTAIISRIKPLSVKYGLGISDHDSEGRLIIAEFDSFYLLNVYVPNSGIDLRRLSYRVSEWDASLSIYMRELEKSKPVILTGDLNCSHQNIDIHDPTGTNSAGFTKEERQSFDKCYLSNGFVDTFRKQHPGVVGYTHWTYKFGGRKRNAGFRSDYFLASQWIVDNVHDSFILPDINGSDHCPIGLVLKL